MTTYEMLVEEYLKLNISEDDFPDMLVDIAGAIPAKIPWRMKIAIAVSEIMTWAGMFRIHIRHWNRSIIPVNAITFIIARSGASKDSSFRAARDCFTSGYEVIENRQKELATVIAKKKAEKEGDDWRKFYRKPNPLFVAISTPEGLVQHLADLQMLPVGAGFLSDSEFGQSLQSNPNLAEVFKTASCLYDMGMLEQKMLKARELQTGAIKQMPLSMLMISSQDMVIYDDAVKRKFRLEFTSKLARRSFLVFANEKMQEPEFDSLDKFLKYEKEIEDKAFARRDAVIPEIEQLSHTLCRSMVKQISVKDEVRDLFLLYKKYNEFESDAVDARYPITRLTVAHQQWKALKLSGAFALLEGCAEIDESHYRAAMAYCRLVGDDVLKFEIEMQKEGYELFVDFVHEAQKNGMCETKIHELKKMGFVNGTKAINAQIAELALVCNSYDREGIYEALTDRIMYRKSTLTNKCLLSYVEVSGDKSQRGAMSARGYECEELEFRHIENMLKGDYAYSNFRFRDGVRGKDTICSGCKWVILDIDDGMITDEECHYVLWDYKHIIARTSNREVATKYRVLLELDQEVDINYQNWPKFVKNICVDLSLKADIRSKSQIWFSYSGREILSQHDGKYLEAKKYMHFDENRPKMPSDRASKARSLQTPMETFRWAYDAVDGEGSVKLWSAAKLASELGASKEEIRKLLLDISDYWVNPFPKNRMEQLFKQIERW